MNLLREKTGIRTHISGIQELGRDGAVLLLKLRPPSALACVVEVMGLGCSSNLGQKSAGVYRVLSR